TTKIQNFVTDTDTKINNAINLQTTKNNTLVTTERSQIEAFRSTLGAADGAYNMVLTVEGSSDTFYPVYIRSSTSRESLATGSTPTTSLLSTFKYTISRQHSDLRRPTAAEYLADSGQEYDGVLWGSLFLTVEFSTES